MKNKYGKTITAEFSNIIIKSKRKPILLKTDDGKGLVNKIFAGFLETNGIKRYSRYTDEGAVFAERFIRTLRDLLKKPIFEKSDAIWIVELVSVMKN